MVVVVGGLHAGKPWREVVHIDEMTGAHGGLAWVLALSCGHFAVRAQPRPKMFEAFRYANGVRGCRMSKPRVAPKRVRCIMCGGAPATSESGA
jgi:hypothetical protein